MLTLVRDYLARFLGPSAPGAPRQIAAGAFGAEGPVSPAFPARLSMAQLVRHPYVWACATKIAEDLAGLPLIAVEIGPDGTAGNQVRLPDALVRRPNASQTWPELRAQLVADEALSGNAYLYRPPTGGAYRLHPSLVQVEADALGLPMGYRFNSTARFTLAEVGHVMGLSWADSTQMLLGESPMRALYDELQAAASAKFQASQAAKRGRAEWLLTPSSEDGAVDSVSVDRIRKAWDDQLKDGKGAVFVGDPLTATPLTMSLRDMEYQVLQERADFAILAVMRVPPSQIGIPAANYGTSKQDARSYWEGLKPRAQRFDAMLTELFGVPGRLEIRHDFSRVEPLQVSRTEQIEQAARLVELGAMPHAALTWCGLSDPPMSPDTEPRETQLRPATAAEVDEPQGVRSLADVLAESRDLYALAVRRGGRHLDRRAADFEALEPVVGLERAADIAALVHAAVVEHLAQCERDGTTPYVHGIGVFHPAFALGLEAA